MYSSIKTPQGWAIVKYTVVVDGLSQDVSSKLLDEMMRPFNGTPAVSTATATPAKRRGRPAGSTNKPKKGPGRPKGSRNKPAAQATPKVAAKSATKAVGKKTAAKAASKPSKRGRKPSTAKKSQGLKSQVLAQVEAGGVPAPTDLGEALSESK